MGITTALNHVTHYSYDRPVNLGAQTIRLRPAPHTRANISSYALKIEPENHFINWQQDPFGNYLARIIFAEKSTSFRVEVDLVSEIKIFNPFDFFLEPYADSIPFAYAADLKVELAPYLEIKDRDPLLMDLVAEISDQDTLTIDYLVALNQKLNALLAYTIRLEPGVQTCGETLSLQSGSCRDMAWLMCQILRHKGLATRFASGYLIQLTADVKSLDGPSGPAADFTDLHAWCEVYLPGAGWIGLDPTSGLFAGEGHIPLCCTPNPSSAAPVSGEIETCEASLVHEMSLTRIHETRRVTKPYSQSEWAAIDALGEKVDQQLIKDDVRLTMGGEPTFVSLDDRLGDEWHFSALSDAKKKLGFDVFQRLLKRFAGDGALVHHGQGKWYPGEILPRWALNGFWRHDGLAMIGPDCLADPDVDQGLKPQMAETFIKALARALGFDDVLVIPAFEDIPYYLWKEQRIPIEGDILIADVYEATERKRLQDRLDADVGKAAGYALPLSFSAVTNSFSSNLWAFRAGKMLLMPGNSPIGLRLPLSALPHVDQVLVDAHAFPERSPFAPTQALDDPKKKVADFTAALAKPTFIRASEPCGLVRQALCAEVRDGRLFIFMPPFVYAEHYLTLLSAIEAVARHLKVPILIEGYAPPRDHRLEAMSVTPDPGVIEVNIQPSRSWPDLKNIITTVYEEAHYARLIADKFLLDGRRVGTGGGNHIVIGAQRPQDSPFLRRPDVLGSMITFWQHHPSLSYLFSGLYIGPTSQAPRIDEARHDALYELEIALDALPQGTESPAWLVDRLLRHLLVDLTGNTHRAEFCIDKLYSPDSDRGRLGLLEMRGYEMSPHPQMNLVQALLIRALISSFWRKPYTGRLVRWGTQLHDKFMLSHHVREDVFEVIDYLGRNGFKFSRDWFIPFFDFRFPSLGVTQLGSLEIELKMALEPWPVLGEEPMAGGTSRSVDSSVERVEVLVRGAVGDQHILTCNGQRLPLTPTRDAALSVCGVRYKAWAPNGSLHPNLPINSPLNFDVLDARLERSIGGCRYHVMHPGGRSYDILPMNENEAEGRRLSRFEAPTHTAGRVKIPSARPNPDYPYTLDLRLSPL
jgi:uncharacterized protein (DUF2126 family)/transglutaminase-like putative cysteine protease